MFAPLKNLPLRAKVWLAPGFLLLTIVTQALFTLYTQETVDDEVREITENLTADADLSAAILTDILQQRLILKSYLKTSDERLVEQFRAKEAASATGLEEASKSITDPERRELVKKIAAMHAEYSHLFEDAVVENMVRRHELVRTKLDANGPPMEDALSEIMETAHRDGDLEAGYQAGVAQRHLLLARLYVYKFLMNNDEGSRQRVEQEVGILLSELAEMHELLQNPERRALGDRAHALLVEYQQAFEGVVAAIDARNAGISKMDQIGPEIAAAAEALHDSVGRSLSEQAGQIHQQMDRGEWITIVLATIAFLLGGVVTWLIGSAILRPLLRITDQLKEIADGDGDLTVRLPADSQDELGQLARNFNRFVEKLQDIISSVQASVSQLATAAEELNVVTSDNRQTVQVQVAETDQVATAVEEMSATLQEVARNVQHTAQAADEARNEATQGREVEGQALTEIRALGEDIRQTADVINAVGQASETVDKVVEVIKSIAEQTNLLALNAAIEAARAGEQGRGFAVVADEVRTLAGRTQESTEEIRQMVENLRGNIQKAVNRMNHSQRQAETVVDQAQEVDRALERINGRVQHMDDMSSQIATATEEQTAVAGEIARNVVNLKDQAGHIATATEQLTDAADGLARLAAALQAQVRQFKVGV